MPKHKRQRRPLALVVALTLGGLATALTPLLSQPADVVRTTAGTSPIRAAFYYPWFAETWHSNDHWTPSAGRYSNDDAATLDRQMADMAYGGLDAAISSWWGVGTRTDRRLQPILDAAARNGMAVTPYYEPEYGDADPTVTRLTSDLAHFRTLTSHSAWLHVDGKPVVFVYNAGATGCGDVARWKSATNGFRDFYVSMKVFPGYASCPDQPSSWHQYGPASSYHSFAPHSVNVSPGFWHHNEGTPRLGRDLNRFKSDLARMVASGAQWQLVTSYSEWGEGTNVESATAWESPSGHGQYVDAMREAFGATTAQTTQPSESPSPSTSPTPTPSATSSSPDASLPAAEDATVRSDDPGKNNNGTTLNTDGSPTRRSYLRFELPDGTPSSGTLRVFAKSTHSTGLKVMDAAESWSESSLTFSNAPTPGTQVGASDGLATGTWEDIEVTGLVPGSNTLVLVDKGSTTNMSMASSESANPPQLVIGSGGSVAAPSSPSQPSSPPTTSSPSPTPTPTSPPAVEGGLVVWAAGDLCDDRTSGINCGELGDLIKTDPEADRFLALGDIAYESGTQAQFDTYYDPQMGGKYATSTRPRFADGRSIWDITYAAVGNHEYQTSGAAPYFGYFGPERAGTPGSGSYFMRDLGAWRVISVNTNCGQAGGCQSGSPQHSFLVAQLQAARTAGDHTLVIGHHPPFSDGGNYAPGVSSSQPLFDAAHDNGADIFLAGHDHQYQRFGAINKSAQRVAGGLEYWVVGTGGKGNTALDPAMNRTVEEYGGGGTLPGGLRLALGANGFTYQFKTSDGQVRFSGSGGVR